MSAVLDRLNLLAAIVFAFLIAWRATSCAALCGVGGASLDAPRATACIAKFEANPLIWRTVATKRERIR